MSKAFDFASDLEESMRAEAIAKRTVYTGISAKDCEDCGEEIPEDRRAAVKLCAPCGALVELRAKGVRRA